jgi:acyl-CoA thioester hydrolase
MKPFVVQRLIEFYDTDTAGIVHFANYYRFMEEAEHALFRALGLKIKGHLPDGTKYGWPRVASRCSYAAPARYDETVEIHLRIAKRSKRSLTTAYEFRRGDQQLAEGEMTIAYCVFPAGEPMQSAAIPDDVAAVLDAAASEQRGS